MTRHSIPATICILTVRSATIVGQPFAVMLTYGWQRSWTWDPQLAHKKLRRGFIPRPASFILNFCYLAAFAASMASCSSCSAARRCSSAFAPWPAIS